MISYSTFFSGLYIQKMQNLTENIRYRHHKIALRY